MKLASIGLMTALVFSAPSFADWQLQADQSQLFFSSIKKDVVAETHHFKTFQATVSADGQFAVGVDLASAETGIPIRNERLGEFLFETSKFAQASAKGKIDLAAIEKLPTGGSQTVKLPVIFELHGKTISQDASLILTKISASQIAVSTAAPIFLNAADFDLLPGIEKLKSLANLPSISPVVPVSLHLRFNQAKGNKA